jgi:hypothetical protein
MGAAQSALETVSNSFFGGLNDYEDELREKVTKGLQDNKEFMIALHSIGSNVPEYFYCSLQLVGNTVNITHAFVSPLHKRTKLNDRKSSVNVNGADPVEVVVNHLLKRSSSDIEKERTEFRVKYGNLRY